MDGAGQVPAPPKYLPRDLCKSYFKSISFFILSPPRPIFSKPPLSPFPPYAHRARPLGLSRVDCVFFDRPSRILNLLFTPWHLNFSRTFEFDRSGKPIMAFKGENDRTPYVVHCQNADCKRAGSVVTQLSAVSEAAPRGILVSKTGGTVSARVKES